jgi:hypothetical protein
MATAAGWGTPVSFYAPLDGSPDAVVAGGSPSAQLEGTPEFVAGRDGRKALLVGKPGSRLTYKTAGNIDLRAGTISVWIKPIDWFIDHEMRFWFSVNEADEHGRDNPDAFLWLYKFFNGSPVFWLVQTSHPMHDIQLIGGPFNPAGYDVSDMYAEWKPNQWHHLAATWCGPTMHLYVNGKGYGSCSVSSDTLLRALSDTFHIGGASSSGKGDCALQDVAILRRPLNQDEVRDLYTHGLAGLSKQDRGRVDLEVQSDYYPSTGTLALVALVDGRRPEHLSGLRLSCTLRRKGDPRGKTVDLGIRPVTGVRTKCSLRIDPSMPGGEYEVVVKLLDASTVNDTAVAGFARLNAKPEWLGNTHGIMRSVPAPWTPIVTRGQTATLWGRTYRYRDSLFPVQITSRDTELLARPLMLLAQVNGKRVGPANLRFRWTKLTPMRVEFETTGTLGKSKIRSRGWIEFDGFLHTSLAVRPVKGERIERLWFEMPLRASIATLQQGRIGNVKANGGKTHDWDSAWNSLSHLWFGNEEVGVQWFTEDDYSWYHSERPNTLSLRVGEQETLFTARMVDEPVRSPDVLEYKFGLIATPMRPMPAHWRLWDYGLDRSCPGTPPKRPGPRWVIFNPEWTAQAAASRSGAFGYSATGPFTRQIADTFLQQQTRFFLYWDVRAVWRGTPEYAYYRSEWAGAHPAPPPLPLDTCGAREVTGADHNQASYRDFTVWRLWKSMHDNPWLMDAVAGLYLDEAEPNGGYAMRLGADGRLHQRTNAAGVRELQKRIYGMLRQEWPDRIIINHQSGNPYFSQLAFSDAYLTGEDFYSDSNLLRDLNYHRSLDLDACRATLTAEHWGLPVLFLISVNNPRACGVDGYPGAEHIAGLLLLHDCIPYPAAINPVPLHRMDVLKQRFGWDDDTQFIGYWKAGNPVTVTADQSPVVASVFTRPGKVMLVVMNNADAPARVTLQAAWDKLGVQAPEELQDAYALTDDEHADNSIVPGQDLRVPVTGNGITFTIPPRNFRVWTTVNNN